MSGAVPFSLAQSTATKEVFDSWLLKMSEIGWSFEQQLYL